MMRSIAPRELRRLKGVNGLSSCVVVINAIHWSCLGTDGSGVSLYLDYKRCARLLTRLAVSPVCMDG